MSSKTGSRIQSFSEFVQSNPRFQGLNKKPTTLHQSCKLPNEILLKIFDLYTDVSDLISCSQVCKSWHNLISSDKAIWLKWSKTYKSQKEYDQLIREGNLSPKQCFQRLVFQKIQLNLFKQFEKIKKRKSLYTGLFDFKSFVNDVERLVWTMEFLDKNGKSLLSVKANEQNNFEIGCSVLWYSFSDLDEKIKTEMTKLKIYAQMPIFLDLKNGKISFKGDSKRDAKLAFKWRRILITEINDFNFAMFKKPNESIKEVFSGDKLIKLFQVDRKFMFGIWNTKSDYSRSDSVAFITFNCIFDDSVVEKLFTEFKKLDKNQNNSKKSNKKCIEDSSIEKSFYSIPSDFKVYLCLRNQTKSIFLSLNKTVYSGKRQKSQDHIRLTVFNCDMIESVGPELSMLPKLTWRTDALDKNLIDLLSIMDFCLFDSNMNLIESNSFPVNILPNLESPMEKGNFISDRNYEFKYNDRNYRIEGEISCLKEGFTYSSKGESFHLTKLEIYLSQK